MRALHWLVALLLAASPAIAADKPDGLPALHAAVSMLGEQQQAVYRQFLMLQELLRANDAAYYASRFGVSAESTEVRDYFYTREQRHALARRGTALLDEANALYREYQELGARKAVLQQRILQLTP